MADQSVSLQYCTGCINTEFNTVHASPLPSNINGTSNAVCSLILAWCSWESNASELLFSSCHRINPPETSNMAVWYHLPLHAAWNAQKLSFTWSLRGSDRRFWTRHTTQIKQITCQRKCICLVWLLAPSYQPGLEGFGLVHNCGPMGYLAGPAAKKCIDLVLDFFKSILIPFFLFIYFFFEFIFFCWIQW